MFRRLEAACALIALAVALLAVGGSLPAEERGARDEMPTIVGASSAVHGAVGRSRRLRSSRGASSDRMGPSDGDHAHGLGTHRWLWLCTAAQAPWPLAPAARAVAAGGPTIPFVSAALATTRTSRGPPARS